MEIFLILTAVALSLTFLFDVAFRKTIESRPFMVGRRKFHHSVLGVLIFTAGLYARNYVVASVGLGMYLSHGLEEMYFNKTRVPKAFFVFVTRR